MVGIGVWDGVEVGRIVLDEVGVNVGSGDNKTG
jgi:hypothetical protein